MVEKRKILVTGTTGTVGGCVLSELKARIASGGWDDTELVTGVRNLEKARATPELSGTEIRHMDFSDAASLNAAFEEIHTLFLLFPPSMDVFQQAKNAIEAARSARIHHIVKICEWDIDSLAKRIRLYAEEQKAENFLDRSGIAWTRIHPTTYSDNFYKFYGASQSIPAGGSFSLAFGDARVQFIDARDVAAAAVKCLLDPKPHTGKSYILTGYLMTMAEAAAVFTQVLGKPVRYVKADGQLAKQEWEKMGCPEWLVEALTTVNELLRSETYIQHSPDLENLLQRRPLSFRQFVEHHKARFGSK
jgi:uncharacterized protein YbjT (DUF2867 family)